MRLTRQQQIQGVQSSDLAAAVWPLLVKEIWQVVLPPTMQVSLTNTEATRKYSCEIEICEPSGLNMCQSS